MVRTLNSIFSKWCPSNVQLVTYHQRSTRRDKFEKKTQNCFATFDRQKRIYFACAFSVQLKIALQKRQSEHRTKLTSRFEWRSQLHSRTMAVDHPRRGQIRSAKFEIRTIGFARNACRFIAQIGGLFIAKRLNIAGTRRHCATGGAFFVSFNFHYSFFFCDELFNIRVRAPLVSWGVERRHQSLFGMDSKRIWAIYWGVDWIFNSLFYFFCVYALYFLLV